MTYEELAHGIAEIVPPNGLKAKLVTAAKEKRPLVVKCGFDPTAPDLHIGHAVVFRKLRQFQEAGHQVTIIIGDATSLIGDPTGRNSMRPPLTPEEIKANAQTYFDQVGKVLDLKHTKIHYNSEWLNKLDFAGMIKLAAQATAAQILQREDFANRMAEDVPVSLHELLYPLVQAYDSFAIKADIEFGGTDQLFNNLMGRHLQERWGQEGQIVMVVPLLRGLDGNDKMSKSKNNYIGITEAPETMYGKAMSIPDSLLEEWTHLATDWLDNERKAHLADIKAKPMDVKKAIAYNIVRQYHGADAAEVAAQHFYNNVQNRDLAAKDYERKTLSELGLGAIATPTLLDLCKALMPETSNSDLKRLIAQGGVAIDGKPANDAQMEVPAPVKIKIGKRGFFEVV
ncbi:MAG: tyrosine--tRNA ligase [Bdellovibrionales bacterium]